jgi:outer membrane protein assembly factor BamD (BamD/ComL family)
MGRDERYEELTDILQEAEEDIAKFYQKENKAAGTRVRKVMQRLKKKAQQVRMEIQDIKKNEL